MDKQRKPLPNDPIIVSKNFIKMYGKKEMMPSEENEEFRLAYINYVRFESGFTLPIPEDIFEKFLKKMGDA